MTHAWELIAERPGGTVVGLSVGEWEVLALTSAAVHRSSDAGMAWSTLSPTGLTLPLGSLAQHGDRIFVGAQSGLARSRDRGHSWQPVLSGASVVCVEVAADGTLLAGI